jgi:hypothetical protein
MARHQRKARKRQLTTRQRRTLARINASYAPIFDRERERLNMKPRTILAKINHRSIFYLVNSMGELKEVDY